MQLFEMHEAGKVENWRAAAIVVHVMQVFLKQSYI